MSRDTCDPNLDEFHLQDPVGNNYDHTPPAHFTKRIVFKNDTITEEIDNHEKTDKPSAVITNDENVNLLSGFALKKKEASSTHV
jgi:hypothetical protein